MLPPRWLWLFAPLFFIAGIAAGIVLAWGPMAGSPVGNSPAQLRRSEKEQYIRMIAAAYAEEGDTRQARRRLDSLGAGNAALWVAELARESGRVGDPAAARLARLAIALDVRDAHLLALASPTLPGDGASWRVVGQETLSCDDPEARPEGPPLLLVRVVDEAGRPLAGVRVGVNGSAGGTLLYVVTDPQGLASTPLMGAGSVSLPGTGPLAIEGPPLDVDCASADSPHAYRVTFQRQSP